MKTQFKPHPENLEAIGHGEHTILTNAKRWGKSGGPGMTTEQHIQRHIMLHKSIDELAADFLRHNNKKLLSNTTVLELLQWSAQQTVNPQP